MYDFRFCKKVVTRFIERRPASRFMLEFLGKSEQDLIFMFQHSQKGWNFFKFAVKTPEFGEVVKEWTWVNYQALSDWLFGLLYKRLLSPLMTDKITEKHEIPYLTTFFKRSILDSASL